jgi:peptidoglycan/LPS O-acetylase OafA/YrhL
MQRLPSLDFLRGTAALAVAIPHFFMLTSASLPAEIASVLAVEIFFVLSGFVLGPQIVRCLQSGRPRDLRIFLTRRWMRTIPPYVFALALISLTVGNVSGADFGRYLLYVENFCAQHNTKDYFPIAWSLSIEEWFYVVFPIVLLGVAAVFRNHRIAFSVLVAIGFIAAITGLRLCFGDTHEWGAGVRRVVIFRVDAIAYGYLLFVWMAARRENATHSPGLPLSLALFAVSALFAVLLTQQIYESHNRTAEILFPFAAAAFGMCSILLFHSMQPLFERTGFGLTAFALFLGQVSYSLYLFHLLIANAVVPHVGALALPLQLAVYLSACLAFSAIFYRLFERPILALRPSYGESITGAFADADSPRVATATFPLQRNAA